jgi:hypothetical protein
MLHHWRGLPVGHFSLFVEISVHSFNESAIRLCNHPRMEDDGHSYILPHPIFARAIMTVAGTFAIIISIYELWRGVWPLNMFSPFFGIILLGALSVGGAFVWAGLVAPNMRLILRPGILEVLWQFLIANRRSTFRTADIQSVDVIETSNSDEPNDWHDVIRISGPAQLHSHPLGTKEMAENLAATFREKLGLATSNSA